MAHRDVFGLPGESLGSPSPPSSHVWSDGDRSGHSGVYFFSGSYNSTGVLSDTGRPDALSNSFGSAQDVSEGKVHGGRALKKVVALGIPPELDHDNLVLYFTRFGVVEDCTLVKDKMTGKSKGFAFITFQNAEESCRAVGTEHFFQDKKFDVKFAFDDGRSLNGAVGTTNRIFVARIPSSVSYLDFKNHFESFGVIRDAYMPKDSSKLGHRGIGFVTYASPDSVEKVMLLKHTLGGNELAVDRANPKEKSPIASLPGRLATSQPNLSGGFGSVPGSHHEFLKEPTSPRMGGLDIPGVRASGGDNIFASLKSQMAGSYHDIPSRLGRSTSNAGASLSSLGSNPFLNMSYPHGGAHGRTFHSPTSSPRSQHINLMDPRSPGNASYLSSETSSANDLSALLGGRADTSQHGAWNETWLGSSSVGVSGPASARAGPRVFVGKLSKESTETDLRQYFGQFGFVLDVYLPRDKSNKREHRGFGFVTFETEASIHRVISHGVHVLHGATLAIDSAVPRSVSEDVLSIPGAPIPGTNANIPFTTASPINENTGSASDLQRYFEKFSFNPL